MAGGVAMLLPIGQPFDLTHSLESGQAFRWRRQGEWFVGAIGDSLVKLRQRRTGLEFQTYPTSEEESIPAIRSYFRLGDDLEGIYQDIARDERIALAISRYSGMRLLRQEPWECLCSFLCSINSNLRQISRNTEMLACQLGKKVGKGSFAAYTFPAPQYVAEAGEPFLRQIGLGFRARYVWRAAQWVAQEPGLLESLRSLSYGEAKERLMAMDGVGDKVADCVLLFSLDHMEAFPIDRWVQRALQEWYLNGVRLGYRQLHQWAVAYFGRHAGYAQQYLFHSRRLMGNVVEASS